MGKMRAVKNILPFIPQCPSLAQSAAAEMLGDGRPSKGNFGMRFAKAGHSKSMGLSSLRLVRQSPDIRMWRTRRSIPVRNCRPCPIARKEGRKLSHPWQPTRLNGWNSPIASKRYPMRSLEGLCNFLVLMANLQSSGLQTKSWQNKPARAHTSHMAQSKLLLPQMAQPSRVHSMMNPEAS